MLSRFALNRTSQIVGRSFVQPLTKPSTFNITSRTFKTVKNIPNKNLLTTIPKRSFNANVSPVAGKYSLNYLIGGAAALGLVGIGAFNYLTVDDNTP